MDNYERQLVESALELLHRLIGYADAKEDFTSIQRSKIHFVEDDPNVRPFVGTKKEPEPQGPGEEKDGTGKPSEECGVIFTEKEILKMPKKFQKLFRTSKAVAHVRLIKGKYYEIRVMIDGEAISASSKSLSRAKEKFIEKLFMPTKKKSSPIFRAFVIEWLDNVVRPFVKESTYEDYWLLLKNHILPIFGPMKLAEIDSMLLQKFINEKGNTRTTGKLYTLLGTIFSYAAPKYIPFSPMQYVKKPIFNPQERKPLSKEEEFAFVRYLFETEHPYRYNFVVILYTGLRRSELKTATFDEHFVTVLSSKQRFGRPEKLRSIPISPILRKFFPLGEMPDVRDDTLSSVFKEINDALGMQHTLHDLRKTFNTRARTCGIPKLLAQHWLGHKPSRDDVNESHYMEYPIEYQLEEIKKFDYEYPDIFPKIFPKI